MTSRLELLRQRHEDIETSIRLAATALQSRSDPTNPHPRLNVLPTPLRNVRDAEQLAADLIKSAKEHATFLRKVYEDEDECEKLTFTDDTEPTSLFYASLRELRDVHRTSHDTPTAMSLTSGERDKAMLSMYQPGEFSGEEGLGGRFVDLQPFYHEYINVTKQDKSLHYYQYVRDKLASFDDIPSSLRCSSSYQNYLTRLISYLTDFARRTHPMDDTDLHLEEYTKQAEDKIKQKLQQWLVEFKTQDGMCRAFDSETIKKHLLDLALKTGGRPEDRAKRLWQAINTQQFGRTAVLHDQVAFCASQLLDEEMSATVANIQKKLSLSYEEIEAERQAEENNLLGNDDDDDGKDQMESTIYNPKDVPLGWDGKPIPYWMYKLHGLNHEFKCEICGGATYKGPRLFERHFTDAVHVGGLKRLGISYSKAFMMITRIQDAIQLHERLSSREKNIQFDSEREVEVEDDNGNVMNLKTFQDLKRQGLI